LSDIGDEPRWPEESLRAHAEAFRWAMPRAFGGEELEPLELHLRYEQLARTSLALALILTQRDSAVGIVVSAGDQRLLAEVRDGAFVTVGIAQLTTSRQGGPPALRWRDGRIDGVIPWATGAAKAKYVVAGAAADKCFSPCRPMRRASRSSHRSRSWRWPRRGRAAWGARTSR
jgi:alkylation response protein AidB-like acyl-CoA dehydrogenase